MEHKLNIAMVLTSYAMGGMEMRSARIARLFAEQGHTVHYGCPKGSKLETSLIGSGVHVFNIHIHGALDIPSAWKLSQYLKHQKIQVLMALSGGDYWPSILASKLSHVPVVISRSTATALNRLTAIIVRYADRILAVSHDMKTRLTDQGIPDRNIQIIYNGIDTKTFSPENVDCRDLLRRRFGIPEDHFVVGCLGRIQKGQALLLSLDAQLNDGGTPIHYFFAGQHIPRLLSPHVKDQPGLDGRVTLSELLAYEDMPAVLHALDAVVMLPETEPFSNSVIEAMAMEKPTVLSKTSGNINAVEDGISGFLVDIHDTAAIVRKLTALRDDPESAQQIGTAARARAVRLYSQQTMLDNYERLYRQLAAQGR